MDKYIKVQMSFWERLVFLFTSLIPERVLPSQPTRVEFPGERIEVIGDPKGTFADKSNTYKPTQPESVPFFEINKDEVKSNL